MSFQGEILQDVRKFVDIHPQKKFRCFFYLVYYFLEYTVHAGVFELGSRLVMVLFSIS